MKFSVDKPYPQVQVEKANLAYASLLLNDYAGIVSEKTAINQYVYQKFCHFNTYPDISLALGKIAMVEMKHLELLGKTIKLLGVNPKFKFVDITGQKLNFWQSKYVNYETDINKLLIDNINGEIEAIKNYQKHLKLINDKYIKNLIKRIIEDEIEHVKCFQKLLDTVTKK